MKAEFKKLGLAALCFIFTLLLISVPAGTEKTAAPPENSADVPQGSAELVPDENGEFTQGDYRFKINDDDTVTIKKYLGVGGEVTVPSELGGRPVTAVGYTADMYLTGAFQDCAELTSVVIPEGVTDIFDNAFYDCAALKTVTVPSTVKVIWNCAFCGCISIEALYFEGDAPQFAHYVFDSAGQPTLYYHEGAAGWTDPFYGCDTEIY